MRKLASLIIFGVVAGGSFAADLPPNATLLSEGRRVVLDKDKTEKVVTQGVQSPDKTNVVRSAMTVKGSVDPIKEAEKFGPAAKILASGDAALEKAVAEELGYGQVKGATTGPSTGATQPPR